MTETLTQKVLIGGWIAGSLISLGLVLAKVDSEYVYPVVAATFTAAELTGLGDVKYKDYQN